MSTKVWMRCTVCREASEQMEAGLGGEYRQVKCWVCKRVTLFKRDENPVERRGRKP